MMVKKHPQKSNTENLSIYKLVDPRDGSIRYVGATRSPLCREYQHFINNIMSSEQVAKTSWVYFLKSQGLMPIFEIIEKTYRNDALRRERYWIEILGPKYNISHQIVQASKGKQ